MRRVVRLAFTLCSVGSLVLGVAAGVLWARSYWVASEHEQTSWQGLLRTQRRVGIFYGNFYLVRTELRFADNRQGRRFQGYVLRGDQKPRPSWSHTPLPPTQDIRARNLLWPFVERKSQVWPVFVQSFVVWYVPVWMVVLLTLVLPAYRAPALLRWLRYRAPGLCPSCGYDLRGTPDRCPECGAVAAQRGALRGASRLA
jgi:hypothetical protein